MNSATPELSAPLFVASVSYTHLLELQIGQGVRLRRVNAAQVALESVGHGKLGLPSRAGIETVGGGVLVKRLLLSGGVTGGLIPGGLVGGGDGLLRPVHPRQILLVGRPELGQSRLLLGPVHLLDVLRIVVDAAGGCAGPSPGRTAGATARATVIVDVYKRQV